MDEKFRVEQQPLTKTIESPNKWRGHMCRIGYIVLVFVAVQLIALNSVDWIVSYNVVSMASMSIVFGFGILFQRMTRHPLVEQHSQYRFLFSALLLLQIGIWIQGIQSPSAYQHHQATVWGGACALPMFVYLVLYVSWRVRYGRERKRLLRQIVEAAQQHRQETDTQDR